jgi:hypothetical protein
MNLANHAAALNSSRGAAFGFASIAKLAGEQLAPYVPPLVPKLYRYPGSIKILCTPDTLVAQPRHACLTAFSAAPKQEQRLPARGLPAQRQASLGPPVTSASISFMAGAVDVHGQPSAGWSLAAA